MFNPKYLVYLVAILAFLDSTACDYYTSVSGLEILLEAEGHLLDALKDSTILKVDSEKKDIQETLSHIREEHFEAKNDSLSYLTNPISAFKLIKRFVVDWSEVEEHIQDQSKDENLNLAISLSKLMKTSFESPTEDDLKGAALGLIRLQETYALNTADLAQGKILGKKYGSEMSASDCSELGLALYQAEEYKRSLNWLLEAVNKIKSKQVEPNASMTNLLRYLSAVYFHLDNPKMALLLTNEILAIEPTNEDALENKEIYERKVFEERNSRKIFRQPFTTPKEPTVDELYEQTCRGERHQTPAEQRPLRCMYVTNGRPYRILAPFKVEQLSLDPPISYYHDVISERDIQRSIKEAEPIIVRSTVGDITSIVSEVRTSKTGWLYHEKHEYLDTVRNALNDITGLSLSTAEALQVVNYGIGGHYGPHWDFSLEPDEAYGEASGNRIATALFYINDVELGGATAFPFLKLAVPPIKGSLVLWYNLHDSLEPDFRTKHAGCPVLKGSKWILNEWYHVRGQELLKPCSLEQEGDISKHYLHVV